MIDERGLPHFWQWKNFSFPPTLQKCNSFSQLGKADKYYYNSGRYVKTTTQSGNSNYEFCDTIISIWSTLNILESHLDRVTSNTRSCLTAYPQKEVACETRPKLHGLKIEGKHTCRCRSLCNGIAPCQPVEEEQRSHEQRNHH
jgi:hypothetical protein